LYRTNAIPSSPVIKADITPWDGTTEEQPEEKEKEVENTELARVNKILGTNLSKLDDIPVIIQNNVNNIFSSAVGSKKLLNTIVEYQELNGIYTFKTVKDIIKEQTGLDVTKLDNSSSDSGVEYEFTDLEGNKYFLIKNEDKLEIKDPDKEVVTKDNLESFVKDLKEVLSGGLSE
jgi:ABC-type Zn uptake system ZnuABC Zn-binding protein ZnuA